jgi:hypothetical protein
LSGGLNSGTGKDVMCRQVFPKESDAAIFYIVVMV